VPGVREKLNALSENLKVHVITSDTFGMAKKELEGVNCIIHVLEGKGHVLQKENYVLSLGADSVVALGNGNNDAKMLKAAKSRHLRMSEKKEPRSKPLRLPKYSSGRRSMQSSCS